MNRTGAHGEVAAHGQHVLRDPRQEPMSQSRNRQTADGLPAVAGLVQAEHTAIHSADVELPLNLEGRRCKTLEGGSGQIGPLRPGASRRVVDRDRLDDLGSLGQSAQDIDLPLMGRDGRRSATERGSRQLFPSRFRLGEVEHQRGVQELGVAGIASLHPPAAHHVDLVADHDGVVR